MTDISISQSQVFPQAFSRRQAETSPHAQADSSASINPVVEIAMKDFISRFNYVPHQTAVLGQHSEGTPILFDLNDPRPGSILIVGMNPQGPLYPVQTMLYSLLHYNAPGEVDFAVISSRIKSWSALIEEGKKLRHEIASISADRPEAGEWIIQLAEMAEERFNGWQTKSPIILVLDEICTSDLSDFDARQNLEWLIQNGPAVHIWPVLAISSNLASRMARTMTLFKTRILGQMDSILAGHIGLYPGSNTRMMDPQREFAIRINQKWTHFWAPILP